MRQLLEDISLIGLGLAHACALPLGWIGGGAAVIIAAELMR